jgi:dihydropteroate synthase
MGVLNVTPDSFSDGGCWQDTAAAVARGFELVEQGADLVDVGGESTRPGAVRPSEAEELDRVLPVVAELARAGVLVSVDTMRASVAMAAVAAGAVIVNDVSGGLADPLMAPVVARTGARYVISHWRGHAATMQQRARYDDVVAEVTGELRARCVAALDAGIAPDRLIVDPGLGFAKEAEHNWQLLAALPQLRALGFPVLVGASRKRFLAGIPLDPAAGPADRDQATHAISALAAQAGAWGVRVHEPRGTAEAVRVAAALASAQEPRPVPAQARN